VGICADTAPGAFVRASSKGWLDTDAELPSREGLEDVAGYCPWMAIHITENAP
jgi:hypothetical protein